MHEVALMSGRIRTECRGFISGKMCLYADRITIVEFTWKGAKRRAIPLANIASVRWQDGLRPPDANLSLSLHDGSVVEVWVKSAGLWRFKIEELAPNLEAAPVIIPEAIQPAA